MNLQSEKWSKIASLQKDRTEAYSDDNDMSPDSIRDEINKKAGSMGFERIGSGDYRVVYSNGDVVVKVAWHSVGVSENRAECKNWRHVKDIPVSSLDGEVEVPARTYLAEIIGYDSGNYNWLAMEPVNTGAENVTHEEASRLREVFKDSGIQIDELYPYNMGTKYREELERTVPVVFDFGGT